VTPKKFRRIEKNWDDFWAEFWRIRLVREDDAIAWKNQQVVEFCLKVLDLQNGITVLDLGCGAGFQAHLLAEHGLHVHGIDISPVLVRYATTVAAKRRLTATFSVGDMRDFKVKVPYDRVLVLGMSFGFGSDAENEAALRCIFNATKPGGRILLTGQHPYSPSAHTGHQWVETNEGFLIHYGDFDPLTSRLGGLWELVRPDGTIITEGENPESEGIRCYAVPEMISLLSGSGFVRPHFYGSWMLPPVPLQWFSAEMITVADKPTAAMHRTRSKRA
jgi:SAM-dependent methyltransferase